MRKMRGYVVATLLVIASAGVTEEAAEVPLGLWQTQPDSLGVVLLVRTRACGRALCARVERAKNRRGYDAPSNAVGLQMMWSMRPQPDGAFFGEYRDTRATRYLGSRVEVAGNKMRVRACNTKTCKERVWTRVR